MSLSVVVFSCETVIFEMKTEGGRQDSPVSRDFEVENLDEADDTQYGAPRTSPEPEPHTVLNENLPPGYEPDNETQLPINPEEEMQGYADRLDQEIRDLREVQDRSSRSWRRSGSRKGWSNDQQPGRLAFSFTKANKAEVNMFQCGI